MNKKDLSQQPSTNSKKFITKDIYFTTVLHTLGFELLRIDNIGNKAIFYFKDSPKLRETYRGYLNDKLKVNPRKLFESWKNIKSLLYSTNPQIYSNDKPSKYYQSSEVIKNEQ